MERAVGTLGAVLGTGLTVGAIVWQFDQAGPARWRIPEAHVLAAAAECRATDGRPADHRCIAAVLARPALGATQLASAANSPSVEP
jgi:hypothetical protein